MWRAYHFLRMRAQSSERLILSSPVCCTVMRMYAHLESAPTRAKRKPSNRPDQRGRPSNRPVSDRIESAMIVHVSAAEGDNFAEYVDRVLTLLDKSNSSAARKTGVHVSLISKWRLGQTLPSIDSARKFADGLGIPRLVVMVKAGILEPEDAQIPALYLELADVDREARAIDQDERRTLREHVQLLVEITRARLDKKRQQRSEKRQAS